MSPPPCPEMSSSSKRLRGNKKIHVAAVSVFISFVLVILYRNSAINEQVDDFLPHNIQSTTISSKNVAAIIENRSLDNLIPIILQFSSVLGPEWPIYIYTSEENLGLFKESSPFKRGVDSHLFRIRNLPAEVKLNTHASVSSFFTKPWFWEDLAPAEHVLMFQVDSIICSNAPQKVEDFLQYDFVGAPVDSSRNLGFGYNGGLSLRNRAMMLDIVRTHDWEEERHGDHSHGNVDYEDQWFSKVLRELPLKADGSPGARLPSTEEAMRFSVETIWYDRPLGYHQANVWQPGKMDEIYKWCPEYKLALTETFTDHNTDPV